jgi:NADH dehydrogenase FAD-containing subunit
MLGGGFGGIYAAIELEQALRDRHNVSVTLCDARQLLSIHADAA